MAKDHVKLEIVNENHKNMDQSIDREIETIFGRPAPAPAPTKNHIANTNHVRLIDTERGFDKNNGNNNNLEESDERSTQPLLQPTALRLLAPSASPETDELDGDRPKDATPYPGIDDELLEKTNNKPERHEHESGDHDTELDQGDKLPEPLDDTATDGKLPWDHDETDYPYDVNGLTMRLGESRPVSPMPGVIPDVNTYQQKKNLAQGMMDLALLSANANQLRYVLESSATHPYYYSSLVFISLSIIFQILVGVGLIMNSQYDVNDHKERCKADKINNMTVLGIFLITIVNVFITSFSVATQTLTVTVQPQP